MSTTHIVKIKTNYSVVETDQIDETTYIPKLGEFVYYSDGQFKVGNGNSTLSNIPYGGTQVDKLTVEVTNNEAIQKINVDNSDSVLPNTIESSTGVAIGVGNTINAAQGNAIGTFNVVGAKGYYWDTFDFNNKTITITNERRKMKDNSDSLTLADISDWQVGDTISLVNHHKYTGRMKITAIDVATSTITVDNLSPYLTKIAYPYVDDNGTELYPQADGSIYYDSADERTICAFYLKEHLDGTSTYWASRSGSVSISALSTAFGAYNLVTGHCALAVGYKNWQSCDYGIVAGVGNKSQYASITAGGSNDIGEYCIAAGRWNKGPESFDYLMGGELNNLTGTMGLTVGAENTVAANFSIVGGYGNISKNSNEGTKHIISGQSNEVDGKNNIVTGELNKIIQGNNNAVFGYNNKLDSPNANTNIVSGNNNSCNGYSNLVSGDNNNTSGAQGITCGGNNTVATNFSMVLGWGNRSYNTNGGTKHIISGQNNEASAKNNVVSGENNTVSGNNSVIFGIGNRITAANSIAAGDGLTINNNASACFGQANSVNSSGQIVAGVGNNPTTWTAAAFGRYADTSLEGLFYIGNGSNSEGVITRSNALFLDQSGNLTIRTINTKHADGITIGSTNLNESTLKALKSVANIATWTPNANGY